MQRFLFCVAAYEVTEDGWIVKGDKQYFFSPEKTSMEEARTFCRNNHGNLATIENNSERKFLWKYVRGDFVVLYTTLLIYPLYESSACEVQKNVLVA